MELRTLRGDEFAGLSALEELALNSNQLTALPEGLFTGLTALGKLLISSNELSALPAGLLSGLYQPEVQFWSHGNPVDALPFTVTLEKVGDERFPSATCAKARRSTSSCR